MDTLFSPDTPDRSIPTCPLCGGRDWRREEGKIDSAWGVTAHRVILLVCLRCSNTLVFYGDRTIFDFD